VFYIYGEVNKPGAFRLEKNLTVMQALSLGGGLTPRGTEKNVQIRRKDASGRYVVQKSSLADIVQADDVVFVRESLF
jgi:polysaccharide export outer membrane protein